jgi:hypothetical protein
MIIRNRPSGLKLFLLLRGSVMPRILPALVTILPCRQHRQHAGVDDRRRRMLRADRKYAHPVFLHRAIEIDLRTALHDQHVPPPLEAVDDCLTQRHRSSISPEDEEGFKKCMTITRTASACHS